MINVTVAYGNNNKYNIDIDENTKLGYLSCYLTTILKIKPESILYLIMGGSIIGKEKYNYDKTLGECNILKNRCVVSLVFKNDSINYPDSDLYLNNANERWMNRQVNTLNINSVLQTLNAFGITITESNMEDILVTISEADFPRYVSSAEDPDDPCSICSERSDTNYVSLFCGHVFHNACIKEWLTTQSVKCPVCNADVRSSAVNQV